MSVGLDFFPSTVFLFWKDSCFIKGTIIYCFQILEELWHTLMPCVLQLIKLMLFCCCMRHMQHAFNIPFISKQDNQSDLVFFTQIAVQEKCIFKNCILFIRRSLSSRQSSSYLETHFQQNIHPFVGVQVSLFLRQTTALFKIKQQFTP